MAEELSIEQQCDNQLVSVKINNTEIIINRGSLQEVKKVIDGAGDKMDELRELQDYLLDLIEEDESRSEEIAPYLFLLKNIRRDYLTLNNGTSINNLKQNDNETE